jgi:hypothetical protein
MSLTFVGWELIFSLKTRCHPEGAFFAPEGPRKCINIPRQIKRHFGNARFFSSEASFRHE